MIGRLDVPRARRVRTLALGTSAFTAAALFAGPAFAQCAPEPTVTNGTTTCVGTDADGLRVTTFGTRVVVEKGATVGGAGGPAVAVRLQSSDYSGSSVKLSVAGLVDGGSADGVSLIAQYIPSNYSQQSIDLTVLAGGRVTGANGVVIGREANASGFTSSARIDNSGSIVGTNGFALLSTDPNAVFSITNRAGGFIGAISGSVSSLSNAGTIEGGSRSAINAGTGYYGTVTNTGTIGSSSADATIFAANNTREVVNSGTIENRGTGAAISGAYIVRNDTTGRIASAGATAISARDLRLTNAGTIVGDVVTTGPSFSNSIIDSTAGSILGALRLGAGDDTLLATFDGTRLQTGISGSIDGGAGFDTMRTRILADTTIAAPLALPTNFEQLSLSPEEGVTATLEAGFTAPGTLLVGGSGTLVNRAALSGAGQILGGDFQAGGYPTIVNAGSIASTIDRDGVYAVRLASYSRFENSGTITATRDAVSLNGSGPVVNSGTITAGGTALNTYSSAFSNTATGVIRSTGGTGLVLSGGSYGNQSTNAGRIEGATSAVDLSGALANTGTIASSGIGVRLNYSATLNNQAGGSISGGGAAAISAQVANATYFTFNNTVANAGTITGDVLLGDAQWTGTNRFFALPGGTLNGDLALGKGDLLVAELANPGPGAFAGITGRVTATDALLRLRVREDTTATIAAPAGFSSVGYELLDGAALTLTGAVGARPIELAGQGSVDLTADIATTTGPAIARRTASAAPGETVTDTALAITSRGTLTLTRANAQATQAALVSLGGADSFTNAGTLNVTDRAGLPYNALAAISTGYAYSPGGGSSITNTGTINLDGAIGISASAAITNSGSITQATGGRASTGIRVNGYGPASLANTGTIDVGGVAVQADYYPLRIENSGRIASSGNAAITGSYGYDLMINNAATGVIEGSAFAIQSGGGSLVNAGTITGTVDLGFASFGGRSYAPAVYTADGGTIAGDLLFGGGSDTVIAFTALGVSGTVDGGDGDDTLIHARRASDTVTLGLAGIVNFERQSVRALGADTVVTVRADAPLAGDLALSGDGTIANIATITGAVQAYAPYEYIDGEYRRSAILAGITNAGEIAQGVQADTLRFENSGTIGADTLARPAVELRSPTSLTFVNDGRIANDGKSAAVSLGTEIGEIVATNNGTITGGLEAIAGSSYYLPVDVVTQAPASLTFTNAGTVTSGGSDGGTVQLRANLFTPSGGTVTLVNSGTIEATVREGVAARLTARSFDLAMPGQLIVTNSGTLRANAGGFNQIFDDPYAGASVPGSLAPYSYTFAASGLVLSAGAGQAQVTNAVGGVIEATGASSVALALGSGTLDLDNAGTIRGGAGTVLASDDLLGDGFERRYLAGAIQARGGDDRINNTGTIIGSVDLGAGDDTIANYGRIEGDVFLGGGNDSFLQLASAVLIGTVDAGDGDDLFTVDATGGGAVNGDQFVNFERFSQIGTGSVAYSGSFRFNTVDVAGGTVTVAEGQTLTSAGAVTITGSDAAETVRNNGTILGGVALAGGDDQVFNRGTIGGTVLLGDGDDRFVDGVGSRVAGVVDGGAGTDTYTVMLAGDRAGLGARTGFERLVLEGTGTLGLTLDQGFETVSLGGTGLTAALNGFSLGTVTGSAAAERLVVDGDVASVSLGAGDDLLSLGTGRTTGRLDGGVGSDVLRFTATGPVTLAGVATGFEQVALAGSALNVTGTLGSDGAPLAFDGGAQALTIASGGTLAGLVDLGAGNDAVRLAAGSMLAGTIAGGAGSDTVTMALAGDRTLAAATFTGFETLASEGRGVLTLAGTQRYDQVVAATDLAVANGASLTAQQVRFAAGDQRFTIAGAFAGAVDGGAGNDSVSVSGGSAAAPVAFTDIVGVEAFAMSAGASNVSGNAMLGAADLSGGRLRGLAGSTITASRIAVGPGAVFGSGGTVNGNLAVAGTLDVGGTAPGGMTVNGDVSLASGSRTLLDLASGAQDRLAVNGAVQIAPGATLQLVFADALRPGATYDLVTASGGINGSFSSVVKPDNIFGFVVQRADRIQLLGQFLADASFSPQVSRSVDYANTVLQRQPANSPLFAVLPTLLGAGGASDPRAFARLTPEPYASATQVGVDNALALAGVARGPGFAADRTSPGGFTFGEAIGSWYRLAGDPSEGVSQARTSSYGFLGGVGYGDAGWSMGAFGGYLDSRQRIDALGARTDVDGWVAGVQGRLQAGAFGLGASIAYNDGTARTDRALPGAATAGGRYDLNSWVSDVSAHYTIAMADWALRPRVGATFVRTSRDGLVEGGGPFALSVRDDRHAAGFVDAGIGFARADSSPAPFRPFVSLGARYQFEGTRADALAGYAGGPFDLAAVGASRAPVVGIVNAGVAYRIESGFDLFTTVSAQTGRDDHREAISAGVRLRF